MSHKLSFLKKKVRKVVPVWLLLVVSVGTPAGAFLWISNTVQTMVTIDPPAIELEGNFETPVYHNVWSVTTLNYTINDMATTTGYIWIEFYVTSGQNPIGSEVTFNIQVNPDGRSPISTSMLYTEQYTYSFEFVYATAGLQPIDFSDSGAASSGNITINMMYHQDWDWLVSFAISSTSI